MIQGDRWSCVETVEDLVDEAGFLGTFHEESLGLFLCLGMMSPYECSPVEPHSCFGHPPDGRSGLVAGRCTLGGNEPSHG